MKNKSLLILMLAIFSSCGSSMEIFSDQDKSFNIKSDQHYKWASRVAMEAKGLNPLYYNELNDKRIREAVNREMALHTFIADSAGSLEIHYHIIVEDKMDAYTDLLGNQQHIINNVPRVTNYQYRQGTLIIDLMDTKTNSLVWRGWATDVISNTVRKDPEGAIRNAVYKIFKKFPKLGN